MKQKVAFLAAMVMLAAAGIALAYPHARSVNAKDVPNITVSAAMNGVETAVQDADKQDGVNATAHQSASQSAAVLAQSPSVLGTLQALNDKANQRFLKPGWLYIKEISEADTDEVKPFVLETLDFGVLRDAQVYGQTSPQVQSDDMLDGKRVVRFDGIERYAKPLQFAVFNQGVVANEGRAYFDPATGQLLQREVIAHLADSSERTVSRSTFEFKSDVTPPAEVIEILVNGGAGK